MQVTKFETLQQYAQGTIVPLPEFSQGQPFVARLKRVSLTALVRENKIPNKLYGAVMLLFGLNDKKEAVTVDTIKNNSEVMDVIAKESLVEPTYDQIREAGLQLTDEQMLAIFNFSQSGVQELETFRTEQESDVSNSHGTGVSQETE